jgi:hypothetical protein
MNLEKILAISGKPGLFILKVQTRSGFVAESLSWKKITVNPKNNVSLLSEISVYTYEAEQPLAEIMKNCCKEGNVNLHKSDNATLAAYFKEVFT